MATQVVRINLAPHEFRRHEPLQINRHGWFGHAQRIGDRRRMRALVNRRQAVTVKRVTA